MEIVLCEKAQKTYASLSIEDTEDYDLVRSAVLKSYILALEEYRQKFRNLSYMLISGENGGKKQIRTFPLHPYNLLLLLKNHKIEKLLTV